MGSIYLDTLPGFLDKWEVPHSFFDSGWARRSRSTGGWDRIWAIGIHHDASSPNTTPQQSCTYMWVNATDRPIGNMLLDRAGHVTLGAGGASNTQGKGGPYIVSRGTIPLDSGNTYMVSIEAANNGLGEFWPTIQQERYLLLCCAIIDWAKSVGQVITPNDIVGHMEWAPTRKIDPAGASHWATGSNKWDMGKFRADLATYYANPTPPPDGGDVSTPDDLRTVLNEGTGFGQVSWASTNQTLLSMDQQNFNLLTSIERKLDTLLAQLGVTEDTE